MKNLKFKDFTKTLPQNYTIKIIEYLFSIFTSTSTSNSNSINDNNFNENENIIDISLTNNNISNDYIKILESNVFLLNNNNIKEEKKKIIIQIFI